MMKTTIKLLALAFVLFATACNNDDEMDMFNSLWRNVTQNEARIDDLEKWCAQANTNITSLQTIVNVIESNDAITSITPVMEGGVEIGYTITFADHDPITIYHGKDGKDGQDGQDGTSPIVGVAKYTDGVYYWTLNGEWLLDENGNKLRVSGANGKDGSDGADGQDGVTPQLKIVADYWWISYDNGNTWTRLGKAKGEDGADGQDGATGAKGDKGDTGAQGEKGDKGDAGDSMFRSVTQDAANVYFTLADGTLIAIAKGGGGADVYTITYMPNGGIGEMVVDTVVYGDSYTIRGYGLYTKDDDYYINGWNTEPNGSGVDFAEGRVINGVALNITLYAQWTKPTTGTANGHEWVDLGLPSGLKWATCNVGATKPEKNGNYYAWGEIVTKKTYKWSTYKWCSGSRTTLTKYNTRSYDGTVDNKTVLDLEDDAARANWGGKWRMPTDAEWTELINNCTLTWTEDYNGTYVNGQIVTGTNGNSIFFPMPGHHSNGDLLYDDDGYWGGYWSSSLTTGSYMEDGYFVESGPYNAWFMCFRFCYENIISRGSDGRDMGLPVRPVLE